MMSESQDANAAQNQILLSTPTPSTQQSDLIMPTTVWSDRANINQLGCTSPVYPRRDKRISATCPKPRPGLRWRLGRQSEFNTRTSACRVQNQPKHPERKGRTLRRRGRTPYSKGRKDNVQRSIRTLLELFIDRFPHGLRLQLGLDELNPNLGYLNISSSAGMIIIPREPWLYPSLCFLSFFLPINSMFTFLAMFG